MLILQTLALEPAHGYAIAQRLQQTSREVVQVNQGSLYPALHRLEQRGWLRAEWRQSDTGRDAKFYTLTRRDRSSWPSRRSPGAASPRRCPSSRRALAMPRLLNLLPWKRRRLEHELARELAHHVERRVDDLDSPRGLVDSCDAPALEFGSVVRGPGGRPRHVGLALARRSRARRPVRRPHARPEPDLHSHRRPFAGRRHRRQRRDLLARRSGPAARPRRPRARSSRASRLEWQRSRRQMGLRVARVVPAVPRAGRTGSGVRRSPVPASDHGGTSRRDRCPNRFAPRSSRAPTSRSRAPRAGTVITDRADDRLPGTHPVVVLSHAVWRDRLGAAPRRARANGSAQQLPDDGHRRGLRRLPRRRSARDSLAGVPAAMTAQAASLDPYWDRLLDRRTA